MQISETTTLALMGYSLLLLFTFSLPLVRRLVPRVVVVALVLVPWAASLLSGALCTGIDSKCAYLRLTNNTAAAIGYYDGDGLPCVYRDKLRSECVGYFSDYASCPDRRRLRNGNNYGLWNTFFNDENYGAFISFL